MDFPELENDQESEELLAAAYRLWGEAKSTEDRRKALLYWLQAAIEELEFAEREVENSSGSLGSVLQAAIQALNMGTALPLMLPTERGDEEKRRLGELAKAKARAVLVVDILSAHPKVSVKRAIEFVCSANGMTPTALESLRSHVHAGKKYREVQANLQPIRDEWAERAALGARLGSPWKAITFYAILRQDKHLMQSV